jgi:Holliday junction resolvase RusA-like endonuclease
MPFIRKFIKGVPYSQNKKRGNTSAPDKWTSDIIKQTSSLPQVKDACVLKVTFLLPPNKYPADLPFGSDLDNLMKRFMDALNETVFAKTKGKDSCVLAIYAMKAKVGSEKQAGALLEILPVTP